jgi:predicted transposase/invertase (TIGR01784 family)
MSFDNVCKLLAEKYPADFVRWLTTDDASQIEVLKTELSIEPIRADSVIFIRTSSRILHIEFQTLTQSKPVIPFRMLDYSVRLKRQYQCPILQIVIFLQETDNEIAWIQEYVDETTTHRYRSLRMWEQDVSLFLGNLALLPLAPLCQTDSPQDLLAQVAIEIAKIEDGQDRQNTAGYTEVLAGLRFEKGLIRELLSEEIMQESVIYQDILQKGEQRGRQQGRQQGEQEEAVRFLNRQLNRRFGQIDSAVVDRIKVLSTEELEILGEEFLDFSNISDLIAWLDTPRSSGQPS